MPRQTRKTKDYKNSEVNKINMPTVNAKDCHRIHHPCTPERAITTTEVENPIFMNYTFNGKIL